MDENKQLNEQNTNDETSTEKEGRLFTQDELNKIIAERLSRERDKLGGENESFAHRETELTEREAALNEQEEVQTARSRQLDERERQVAEKEAELDAKILRADKLAYLTEQLHIQRGPAKALVATLGGDTLPEFKDLAKTAVSALGARVAEDITFTTQGTVDGALREAFGLQKG